MFAAGPGEVDWRQLVMVVGSEMVRIDEACEEAIQAEGTACSSQPLHHPSPRGEARLHEQHMRAPLRPTCTPDMHATLFAAS